jgi:hypothetical protein
MSIVIVGGGDCLIVTRSNFEGEYNQTHTYITKKFITTHTQITYGSLFTMIVSVLFNSNKGPFIISISISSTFFLSF